MALFAYSLATVTSAGSLKYKCTVIEQLIDHAAYLIVRAWFYELLYCNSVDKQSDPIGFSVLCHFTLPCALLTLEITDPVEERFASFLCYAVLYHTVLCMGKSWMRLNERYRAVLPTRTVCADCAQHPDLGDSAECMWIMRWSLWTDNNSSATRERKWEILLMCI